MSTSEPVQRQLRIDTGTAVVTPSSILSELQRPLEFMQEIGDSLEDRGVWLLEHYYMPAMLHTNAYDSVRHDRLSYYGVSQIKWMADRVGLTVIDVKLRMHVASLLIVKGRTPRTKSATLEAVLDDEARQGMHMMQPYSEFARRVAAGAALLRTFLDRARVAGKLVCGLGASQGGNVILQYCSVSQPDVASVGEVSSERIGAFTPGTELPIAAEEDILELGPDFLLVLPTKLRSTLVKQARFAGQNLLIPLPNLEVVRPAPSKLALAGN